MYAIMICNTSPTHQKMCANLGGCALDHRVTAWRRRSLTWLRLDVGDDEARRAGDDAPTLASLWELPPRLYRICVGAEGLPAPCAALASVERLLLRSVPLELRVWPVVVPERRPCAGGFAAVAGPRC